ASAAWSFAPAPVLSSRSSSTGPLTSPIANIGGPRSAGIRRPVSGTPLFMNKASAEHYHYIHRKTVDSSLHGRIGMIPGKLLGYGERWDGDECTLWCEGVMQ